MGKSEEVRLYRCPTHGYMEHANAQPTWTEHDHFKPSGPPTFHCAMSDGPDETCGFEMDGPFLFAARDERDCYKAALEQIAGSVDGEHRMGRMEVARLAVAALNS